MNFDELIVTKTYLKTIHDPKQNRRKLSDFCPSLRVFSFPCVFWLQTLCGLNQRPCSHKLCLRYILITNYEAVEASKYKKQCLLFVHIIVTLSGKTIQRKVQFHANRLVSVPGYSANRNSTITGIINGYISNFCSTTFGAGWRSRYSD